MFKSDLEATTSHCYFKSLFTWNWSRCPEDLKFWRWFTSLLMCWTKLGFGISSRFLGNFEVKLFKWPLYVLKIICLKFWSSILKGSGPIDSKGQNGHFGQNQSKSGLTQWILVNHQFKGLLFIFQVHFDHWIKKIEVWVETCSWRNLESF